MIRTVYQNRLGAKWFCDYEHNISDSFDVTIKRIYRDDRKEITTDMLCFTTNESSDGQRIVKGLTIGSSKMGIYPDGDSVLLNVINPQHIFSYEL